MNTPMCTRIIGRQRCLYYGLELRLHIQESLNRLTAQDCRDGVFLRDSQKHHKLKLRRYFVSENERFKKYDNGSVKAQLVSMLQYL
jgi:hypothetical protein